MKQIVLEIFFFYLWEKFFDLYEYVHKDVVLVILWLCCIVCCIGYILYLLYNFWSKQFIVLEIFFLIFGKR